MYKYSKTAWGIANRYSAVLASETRDLAGAIDEAFRRVIDETWGEALEDGSVPSTKLQDKIIAALGNAEPQS